MRAVVRAARAALAAAFVVLVAQATVPAAGAQGAAGTRWPVKTREHVDLWLHGFAFVAPDSSRVPLYRRGYRDALIVARNSASAITELDANADVLKAALASRGSLLGAQFLALEFGSWADLSGALEAFVRADGDPRKTASANAQMVARIGTVFHTKEDRDFARRYLAGLQSERDRFHHQWWVAETRRRDAALAAVDSLWHNRFKPALQRFLNHTQQPDGELILSTVLEGEGRTVTNDKRRNTVVVGFPETPARAADAIYCFLHELVGAVTGAAVEDNVTPAQKRNGVADGYGAMALVRGGAILAARVSPDAATDYMAFYLRAAGIPAGPDLAASFAAAFPLPDTILASIERQIGVAFSGI